ncbi:integrator complex subunit 12 [Lucilia sericata]|uniref:integrator complex subunit 12 n=1 Tax=Lucilia sericata TaxID=13632 RepID=UPI0018A84F65|nr:integrator complex subunit 12 [Lucilia sericata]
MTTTNEIEILLKKAVTLLHSSHANSATELRLLLDEEIKKRYGSEKTITNSLSKKQLDDEANFPGRAATPPPQPVETEEVINLIHSPAKTISDSPDTIADSDDAVSGAGGILSTTAEDETNLKEFGDLNCCVCGEIRFTATNRLIECSKCGALYHQECHKPPISDEEASEEQGHNWQCDNCIGKPTTATSTATTKLSGSCTPGVVVIPDEPMPLITNSVPSIKSKSSATSSRSSSSSNSSSPYHKIEHVQVVNSVVSGKTSSSSSKSHREDRMSTGSNSSKVTTINSSSISSTSSTNKKHSSSGKSKSSKHHDSKRKSNK